MGFLDKYINLKDKPKGNTVSDNEIVALAAGKQINISTVSDPVFAEQLMGKSVAFKYSGDKVTICSPANGVLTALFPTAHAFGITMNNGVEILVHIGIDTVQNHGDGFKVLGLSKDDVVAAGRPIVEVDLSKLNERYDMTTMIIIVNDNGYDIDFTHDINVDSLQIIATI